MLTHPGCRLIPAAPRPSAGLTPLSHSNRQALTCRPAAEAAGAGSKDPEEKIHEEMRRLAKPYRGVSWDRQAKKFQASVRLEGRSKHLGYFHKPEEAAEAFKVARLEHPLQNRERQAPVGTPADWESEEFHRARAKEAAQHRGVHWDRSTRKFSAQIGGSRGRQFLGLFQTAAEAGAAYAEARSKDPYAKPPAVNQSDFTGVSWTASRECWEAYQRWEGKKQHLGSFDNEHAAARAVRVFLDTHCGGWRNPRGVYLEEGDKA